MGNFLVRENPPDGLPHPPRGKKAAAAVKNRMVGRRNAVHGCPNPPSNARSFLPRSQTRQPRRRVSHSLGRCRHPSDRGLRLLPRSAGPARRARCHTGQGPKRSSVAASRMRLSVAKCLTWPWGGRGQSIVWAGARTPREGSMEGGRCQERLTPQPGLMPRPGSCPCCSLNLGRALVPLFVLTGPRRACIQMAISTLPFAPACVIT
jgi:hypothetical protein